MATSRLNLKTQLIKSATPGSILATNTSNEIDFVAPPAGHRLWGYDHTDTATVGMIIGTNLSYDPGTNTLSATAGAGGYSDVQDEGSGFTNSNTNTKLNFVGAGITAADAGAGVTSVTIASFLNTLATQGNVNLATQVTGDLPFANLAQGSALSVLGVAGNAIADNASITAGSDGNVLRRSGTTLGFGAIDLASANAVSGVLDETNGGTGQSTITTGDILYGSASNTLSKLPIGAASTYLKGGTTPSWATLNVAALSDAANVVQTSGTFTLGGAYTFSQNVVLNGTPSASNHAVTKGYVDDLLYGLSWKDSVDVATTANITLSGEQTIDGVLTSASRVLVKNQSTQSQNGIYVSAAGAWTRATDMDAWSEVPAAAVFVEAGTTQADTAWVCTSNDGGTLGTTNITFVKFSSASGVIDGSGATNKVAYWSDVDTLTSTTNFHFNGTQLGVGTDTPASNTVVTTKGTGAGNTTFGKVHQNSSGTQVFRVADDGTTVIGTGTPLTITLDTLSRGGDIDLASTLTAGSIRLMNTALTSAANNVVEINPTVSRVHTSGSHVELSTLGSYTVSSGTGNFTSIAVSNTINQSGGTGVVRGLHVNPTLTSAQDYRGVEITTSATQYALWTTAGKVRFDLGSDATGDLFTRASGGELARIAAGTSGHVLTSNGAGTAPTYQALPATGTTVTRAYITGQTTNTFDLDANTGVVKDRNNNNVAFTIPTATDQFFVYLNGQRLLQGGTGDNRDYSVNTTTHVLTLEFSLVSTDVLLVEKFS